MYTLFNWQNKLIQNLVQKYLILFHLPNQINKTGGGIISDGNEKRDKTTPLRSIWWEKIFNLSPWRWCTYGLRLASFILTSFPPLNGCFLPLSLIFFSLFHMYRNKPPLFFFWLICTRYSSIPPPSLSLFLLIIFLTRFSRNTYIILSHIIVPTIHFWISNFSPHFMLSRFFSMFSENEAFLVVVDCIFVLPI